MENEHSCVCGRKTMEDECEALHKVKPYVSGCSDVGQLFL